MRRLRSVYFLDGPFAGNFFSTRTKVGNSLTIKVGIHTGYYDLSSGVWHEVRCARS